MQRSCGHGSFLLQSLLAYLARSTSMHMVRTTKYASRADSVSASVCDFLDLSSWIACKGLFPYGTHLTSSSRASAARCTLILSCRKCRNSISLS